jgi:hypothetical protein
MTFDTEELITFKGLFIARTICFATRRGIVE